jgi:hypothetical protein
MVQGFPYVIDRATIMDKDINQVRKATSSEVVRSFRYAEI